MDSVYDAQTSWFHLFKAMFDSGDVAKMSPPTFTVYCCIKSHLDFHTGVSFPSVETIAEKTGISSRQVLRCLKTLEEMGYLTRRKEWRKNVYTLREKVQFTDKDGRPAAVATFDYLPSLVKEAQAELNNVRITGDMDGTKVIHIEKLVIEHINIVQGDQTVVNIDTIKDPQLRKRMERLITSKK